jgi:Periplasmic binding protein
MNIRGKMTFLVVAVIVSAALGIDPAFAHRFNVTLVIEKSIAASERGGDIRDGFMLATTERDSHAGQESDGHLGGLDVYVTVLDEQADSFATQGGDDIVVVFGSSETISAVGSTLDGTNATLLVPGETPFSDAGQPEVAAFRSAYERAYGTAPTTQSAQGYNAARRIDVAVRAQGGVADTASLRRSFNETARRFSW